MQIPAKPIRRVLLVGTNVCNHNDYRRKIMPTQLDYLASELAKNGVEVTCLDLSLHGAPFVMPGEADEKTFNGKLYEERKARLVKEVEQGRYDLVGLSFRNMDLSLVAPDTYHYQTHFLGQLDGLVSAVSGVPNRPVLVMGGPAFSLFPKELMARWPSIDFGIAGAGEGALPWLVEQLSTGQPPERGVIRKPFNFREAGFRRGFIDLETYFKMAVEASVQTKRGCDALCSYCNYPLLEGARYQLRGPALVVDEISALKEKGGFQAFYFLDSVFNWPTPHAKEIMQEIIRRRLDIRYDAMINPRGIDEEFVDLAEESGLFKNLTALETATLHDRQILRILMAYEGAKEEGIDEKLSDGSVEFDGIRLPAAIMDLFKHVGGGPRTLVLGIDSGDDTELSKTGKGFTSADIRRVTGILRRRGIPFTYDLLFGGPATTEQSIRNTIRLALDTGASSVFVQLGIRVYPNTRLAAATKGALWKTTEELLPLVSYPPTLDHAVMRDIIGEYCDKLRVDFHFDRHPVLI